MGLQMFVLNKYFKSQDPHASIWGQVSLFHLQFIQWDVVPQTLQDPKTAAKAPS